MATCYCGTNFEYTPGYEHCPECGLPANPPAVRPHDRAAMTLDLRAILADHGITSDDPSRARE